MSEPVKKSCFLKKSIVCHIYIGLNTFSADNKGFAAMSVSSQENDNNLKEMKSQNQLTHKLIEALHCSAQMTTDLRHFCRKADAMAILYELTADGLANCLPAELRVSADAIAQLFETGATALQSHDFTVLSSTADHAAAIMSLFRLHWALVPVVGRPDIRRERICRELVDRLTDALNPLRDMTPGQAAALVPCLAAAIYPEGWHNGNSARLQAAMPRVGTSTPDGVQALCEVALLLPGFSAAADTILQSVGQVREANEVAETARLFVDTLRESVECTVSAAR